MPESSFQPANQILITEIDQDSPITEGLMNKYRDRDIELMDLINPLGAPGAVGAGSRVPQEGDVVITADLNLDGLHYYNNLTIDAGITVTALSYLMIQAQTSITVAGTINADGGGNIGGLVPAGTGNAGISSRGGSGGSTGTTLGGQGGGLIKGLRNYLPTLAVLGSSQGGSVSTDDLRRAIAMAYSSFAGGAGGGAGAAGPQNGGTGGGTIILIAPTINLTGGALTANGNPGFAGSLTGGGGGGGGLILLRLRTYTAGTITVAGGAGGTGTFPGGPGSSGAIQIDIV